MRCNTPLMNSWHSFSPNGRWMVFSSKSRSPYTQMFLTHIDEQGNDTPAILIENSTAANRAVNIPEFVNIPPDGLLKIDAPVTEYYRLIDVASEAMNKGDHEAAIPLLKQALATNPGDAVVHNSYGSALAATGHLARSDRAVPQGHRAEPGLPGRTQQPGLGPRPERPGGRGDRRVQEGPRPEARLRGGALGARRRARPEGEGGRGHPAPAEGRRARARRTPLARTNLCLALSMAGRAQEAIPHAQQAVTLSNGQNPLILDLLGRLYAQAGRLPEAIETTRQALEVASQANDQQLARDLQARLSSYEAAATR